MARTRSKPATSPKTPTSAKAKKVGSVATESPLASPSVKKNKKKPAKKTKEATPEAEAVPVKESTEVKEPVSSFISEKVATKAIDEITKYLQRESENTDKEKLFDDDDDNLKTLFLQLNTKKFSASRPQFKPKFIKLSHSIYPSETKACLIIRDQLVKTTEQLEALESENLPYVSQILPVNELKTTYKSFEKRRQLHDEYDLFIVDDAVFNLMPSLLGKTFYGVGHRKIPLPIRVTSTKSHNELSITTLKNQLEKCLNSTIYLPPTGVNISIKVGAITDKFETSQLVQNLQDALSAFEKDSLKSVMVRTVKSPSLPLYYAEKL
ncbi:ribosomal protein L1, partial [Suhomyces tanzawaensis NRRL Y-17324]